MVWSAALTEHFVAQHKFSLIYTPGNFFSIVQDLKTGATLHCTSAHVDLWRSWLYCCDIVEPWNHIPTVPCLPHTPSSAFYSVGDKSWGVKVLEWGQVRTTSHWNLAPNYTDKSLHLQTHTYTQGNYCNATYVWNRSTSAEIQVVTLTMVIVLIIISLCTHTHTRRVNSRWW